MDIKEKKSIYNFLNSIDPKKISIPFCERFDEKSNIWNLKKHKHKEMEIIYFLDGKASVQFVEKTIELSVYDVVVYPPNVIHKEFVDMNKHQEIICMWIEYPFFKNTPYSFKLVDRNGVIKWLVEQIYIEYINNNEFKKSLILNYFSALLLNIKIFFKEETPLKQDIFGTLTEYINKNLASDITISKLTAIVNVSPSYLNRYFRKKFGKPPIQYINYLRLKTAKRFLTSSERSIREIAILVGFQDPQYFWRIFKRFNSYSPSEYRKKYTELYRIPNE